MLFVNPLGKTVTKEVSITGTTTQGLSECTQPLERRDMLCAGSGVVFVFNDTNITDKLVKTNYHYTASLLLTGCSFFNNTNLVPINLLLELVNIFHVGTQRILLIGGFSIALGMGQILC